MKPRGRDAGREPAEQRQGIHVDRDGAVGICALEREAHEAVRAWLESLLGERRAKHGGMATAMAASFGVDQPHDEIVVAEGVVPRAASP